MQEDIGAKWHLLNEEYDAKIKDIIEKDAKILTKDELMELKKLQQELFSLEENIFASCQVVD